MTFEGTVHKYGRDVDTDVIIPARYLNTNDPAELPTHCMEDIDAGVRARACGPATSSSPARTSAAAARASTRRWRSRPAAWRRRGRFVRAHLLPQRHQHRAADRGLPGGRRTRRRPATGCGSTSSPGWSRTSPGQDLRRPTPSRPSCASSSRAAACCPTSRGASAEEARARSAHSPFIIGERDHGEDVQDRGDAGRRHGARGGRRGIEGPAGGRRQAPSSRST